MMTNEQKAKEIATNEALYGDSDNNSKIDECYIAALEMAKWKDTQRRTPYDDMTEGFVHIVIGDIKRQISCFKSEKSKVGASQTDKLSLGGRIAALEEFLAYISTDERPLTPEILTAAGWIKWHENDAVVNFEKEVDDVCFNLDFRKRIKKIDIQVDNCIKARLNNVTVMEFNTLLDIVKLNKFKIK